MGYLLQRMPKPPKVGKVMAQHLRKAIIPHTSGSRYSASFMLRVYARRDVSEETTSPRDVKSTLRQESKIWDGKTTRACNKGQDRETSKRWGPRNAGSTRHAEA